MDITTERMNEILRETWISVVRRHREHPVPMVTRGDNGEDRVFRDPWSVQLPTEAPRAPRSWVDIETALSAMREGRSVGG